MDVALGVEEMMKDRNLELEVRIALSETVTDLARLISCFHSGMQHGSKNSSVCGTYMISHSKLGLCVQ